MKTFSIIFSLYLTADQTEDNQTLFTDLCDKVIARLQKYHGGYVAYDHGSPADYELDPGYPFHADIFVEPKDAYDPTNFTEDEVRGLLSGDIDFCDTGYFKGILYDVDFILDDEKTTQDDKWYVERDQYIKSDDAFEAHRYYRIAE